jgi:DNA invertase Pin-like site-specific DNA recombinase
VAGAIVDLEYAGLVGGNELDRAMIRERVMAGLGRARAQGRKLGRPKVAAEVEASIRLALAGDKGIGSTARELGVGVGSVHRVRKEMDGSSAA